MFALHPFHQHNTFLTKHHSGKKQMKKSRNTRSYISASTGCKKSLDDSWNNNFEPIPHQKSHLHQVLTKRPITSMPLKRRKTVKSERPNDYLSAFLQPSMKIQSINCEDSCHRINCISTRRETCMANNTDSDYLKEPSTAKELNLSMELRERDDKIMELKIRVSELEKSLSSQKCFIEELNSAKLGSLKRISQLEEINKNLMNLINHGRDSSLISNNETPYEDYTDFRMKKFQKELEQIMREKQDIVKKNTELQVENTELKNELSKLRNILLRYRRKERKTEIGYRDLHRQRQSNIPDDTMSMASIGEGEMAAPHSRKMTNCNLSPTKIKTQSDVQRWYKIYQLMERISRCGCYKDVLKLALNTIPQIIECDKWSIFIVNKELSDYSEKFDSSLMKFQRVFHLHKWFNALATSEDSFSEPQFKHHSWMKIGHKSHKLLFKGIIDSRTREVFAAVQLERLKSGNMYTGIYSGFSELDEGLLSLLCTFIGIKFTQIGETMISKMKDKRFMDTINSFLKVLKQKWVKKGYWNIRNIKVTRLRMFFFIIILQVLCWLCQRENKGRKVAMRIVIKQLAVSKFLDNISLQKLIWLGSFKAIVLTVTRKGDNTYCYQGVDFQLSRYIQKQIYYKKLIANTVGIFQIKSSKFYQYAESLLTNSTWISITASEHRLKKFLDRTLFLQEKQVKEPRKILLILQKCESFHNYQELINYLKSDLTIEQDPQTFLHFFNFKLQINSLNSLFEYRTYIHLILHLKEVLPPILGFEFVGIYFLDTQSEELCTCFNTNFSMTPSSLTRYPFNIGITGSVFQEQNIIISLKGKKEKNFHEIDNSGSFSELRNFIFLPMTGINGKHIGVLQCFNHLKHDPSESDLEIIRPFQHLVGVMVNNITELNAAMDMTVAIKDALVVLENKANIDEVQELEFKFGINKIKANLSEMQKIVTDKLEKEHTKYKEIVRASSYI